MAMKKVAEFSERLTEAMGDIGPTALADKVGLSKQAISSYRSGVRQPKIPTVESIARVLGVKPTWLMGYDVPKHDDLSQNFIKFEKRRFSMSDEYFSKYTTNYKADYTDKIMLKTDRMLSQRDAEYIELYTDAADRINYIIGLANEAFYDISDIEDLFIIVKGLREDKARLESEIEALGVEKSDLESKLDRLQEDVDEIEKKYNEMTFDDYDPYD